MKRKQKVKCVWRRAVQRGGIVGAILMMGLLVQACQFTAPQENDHISDQAPQQALHVLGLTQQQREEDYQYLWNTLRENYPCWGILQREGVEVDTIYQSYLEMVEQQENDVDFYSAIYSALFRLGQNGHLWIVTPEDYDVWRQNTDSLQENGKHFWADVLNNPETAEKYEKLRALEQALEQADAAEPEEEFSKEQQDNITTFQLPEQKIGYVKIASFTGDMQTDKTILDAFYAQCASYNDLIIDLTQNSGGSEDYWIQLLAAPHIEAPLSYHTIALTRKNTNNLPYLEQAFSEEMFHPLKELPEMPHLASEDLALATDFIGLTTTVEPAKKRSPFHGRIWVLVSDSVYSASESFAIFCKQTGFATLVGTQTGGDGIGSLEPVFLQLPNSGILVQYTAMFGLNADGRSNEEYGTTPDIISPEGEVPLVTVLRHIQEGV